MRPILEYYADEAMIIKIPTNENGQPIFDWGECIAGQTKNKTVYIKNTKLDKISLRQPYSKDESLKIIDYPITIPPRGHSTITLQFAPTWERDESLKTAWGFELVIG